MMDVTRGVGGEVVIRVGGNFDAAAASRLEGWLREVPTSEAVVLDFGAARDCHDFGLAAVAETLAQHERVTVRGLSRHQERLLRYFGVELGGGTAPDRIAG